MTYDSRLNVFLNNIFRKRKNKFGWDDGIDWQWGDRYIRSTEVVSGVGGKYWRDNHDGTMTIFSHPINRFRAIVNIIDNRCDINSRVLKTHEKNYTIIFKHNNYINKSIDIISQDDYVRNYMHIAVKDVVGKKLILSVDENVLEDNQEIMEN